MTTIDIPAELKSETTSRYAVLSQPHPADPNGVQVIYNLGNGYLASVVRNSFSYGREDGLWELGVKIWEGPEPYQGSLTYATPITNGVLGHLDPQDVERTLLAIRALPSRLP